MPARIPALDGLRGLAVSLVMLHHFFQPYDPETGVLDRLLFGIAGSGWTGVDLFFVLSGFLITGILLDTKGTPHYLRNFYARRTLRIFPLYYAALLVFFVVFPALPPPGFGAYVAPSAPDQLWFWTYLTNFRIAANGHWYPTLVPNVFWSLAIEEQFYLIWPLVVLRLGPRALMALCVGLFVGALALRLVFALVGVAPLTTFVLTFTRVDCLALGATLALPARTDGGLDRAAWWARRLGPPSLLLLIVLALPHGTLDWQNPWTNTVGFSLVALLWGAMIVMTLPGRPEARVRRVFEAGFMRTLGKYSYALYVVHGPAGPLIARLFDIESVPLMLGSVLPSALLYATLTAGLSLLVAWLSWHLLERRCLALQHWFRAPRDARGRTAVTS
jgi:peptidoglycan/LPS O-acetylase OafA/YrhL